MDFVVQRTISELATLYRLEPSVRDVFVEGESDSTIIRWYIKNRLLKVISVREANTIFIPQEILRSHGINSEDNFRGRLIVLAKELETLLDDAGKKCITIIYDSDFDCLSGISHKHIFMLSTDFSCLEMYLFNIPTIDKLMSVVLMGCSTTPEIVFRELEKVLIRLWVIKAANHLLGFGMSWITFEKLCHISGRSIIFKEKEFIRRYLTNSGQHSKLKIFENKIAEIQSQLTSESRHHMNGHHFITLTRWFLRKFAGKKNALKEEMGFERSFFGCIELNHLDAQPMFQALLTRLSN